MQIGCSFLDSYYQQILGKDDDINLLLQKISENYNFNICGMIFFDGKENKQIGFYDKEGFLTELTFTEILDNFLILDSKEKLVFRGYKPKNGIVIPVAKYKKLIGYVYLLNSKEPVDYKIILNNNGLLYVCETILNKFSKSNNSRDLFIANVSHEIRTPLNGIVGYSQLLSSTNLDITQSNYVSCINQCSIQLMQIINDILDYCKLTAGKMKIKTECFSLKEIIENVNDATSYKLKEKRLIYHYSIDEKIPNYIISDKQRITQVIVNLLSNSIKFTHQGGVIELSIVKKEANFIEFTVKDTGIGISDEDKKHIFNEYTQGNENISTTYGGTGLGLSICKKLTELLGGGITFKSELHKGSEFSFFINYKPYEEEEKKITKNLSKNLTDKYVLVVDDNSSNRVILSETLFEWGMKPVTCACAFEAIRLIAGQRYNFSIALIDICMPGTNGIQLAKQIKQENSCIPLIAISSLDDPFSKSENLDFEDKLYKPINKILLYQTLEKFLKCDDIGLSIKPPISPMVAIKRSESKIENVSNLKILIAEDVTYNQTLLETMLQKLGYNNIKSVSNGLQVVEQITTKTYDVLLLDLRMPEMNGFEVIEYIKKEKIEITILPVTASVVDEDKEKCRSLGVNTFLTKPIDIRQLKIILSEIRKL